MNTVLYTPSYDRIVKIMKYFGSNVPVAAPLPHNNRRSRKHLIGRACLLPLLLENRIIAFVTL